MAHDVFISYSSHDKPTADAVCARLEARGVRCWIAPRDVTPGAEWSEAIIDGINGSRAVVLVYSKNANDSPQIRREVERAVAKRIAIIPLRLEDVPMSKSLEYFISTPHWLDAMTPPLEQHLDYLAETLRRLVHPPKEELPPPVPPKPVPYPVPTPVPRRSWIKLAIAAGVALVLLVAAVMYFFGEGFDTRLTGSWTGRGVVNNVPVELSLTLAANGQGTATSSVRDHGRYNSARGQWVMTNAAGQTLRGTYVFTSTSEMSMAGPLGTATWRREGTSIPDPAGGLLGKWTLGSTSPEGLPVTTTLIFAADGTYQFDASSVDTIAVQAGFGKWRANSFTNGRVTEGLYKMLGPDEFILTSTRGTQGTTSWTRRATDYRSDKVS